MRERDNKRGRAKEREREGGEGGGGEVGGGGGACLGLLAGIEVREADAAKLLALEHPRLDPVLLHL